MLKKLLKHELKNIFKFLSVFYILALFFSILTRIFFCIEGSLIMNIIAQICSGAAIAMMFNIIINNLMRSWVRFKSNLYGDESYLTHTLPVSKKTLYLSKIITAIVSLLTSIIVIGITIFIAYYSKENLLLVKKLLLPVAETFDSTILNLLLAILFVLFLELANGLQVGYSGIILGHRMNNLKIVFSVIYGFGLYMVMQVFGLLIIFITSLFNSDLLNLFITNEMLNIGMIKVVIYLAIFIYLTAFIINLILNIKLLKKGVNVE